MNGWFRVAVRLLGCVLAGLLIGCGSESGADSAAPARLTAAVVTAPPTIRSFTAKAAQGATVVITGTNFVPNATVAFTGASAASVQYVTASRLEVVVPPLARTGPLWVTTPLGTATTATSFGVLPSVPAFSPAQAFVGDTVTLVGGGYTQTTSVKFGALVATFVIVDDAHISAVVPPGATNGKITVATPQGSALTPTAFVILPVISALSPEYGVAGDTVTIFGVGFANATAVKFGTLAAAFTVTSDTEIRCTVPPGAKTGKLTVDTSRGSRKSAGNFTIVKRPTIGGFTPSSTALPATITIDGTNFVGITSVRVGGIPLVDYTVSAGIEIEGTVPLGTPSGSVTVTNAAGTATSEDTFTTIDRCAGVVCVAADACHPAGTCDQLTGECSTPVAPDGTGCSDGDACTRSDRCVAGACVGADPVTCAPIDACHVAGVCDPASGSCTNSEVEGVCGCGALALDTDSDGSPDCADACPHSPEDDADSDGVCEDQDNCAGIANADQADTDADGRGDPCDQAFDASVALGGSFTCAIREGGKVYCWGANDMGMLGDGTGVSSLVPVQVVGITDAIAIDAGWGFACALRASGEVQCWGGNSRSELGNGDAGYDHSAVPVSVVGLTDAVALSSGGEHSCALRASGAVVCWGDNYYGQLGSEQLHRSATPVEVPGLTEVVLIDAGVDASCARRAQGEVYCWGRNYAGQLANGSTADSRTPTRAVGLDGAVAISIGQASGCALLATGEVACWGGNYQGRLGNGTTTNSPVPVIVPGLTGVEAIQIRGGHACARLASGEVDCWGSNYEAALGNGSPWHSATPVPVAALTDAVGIAAGYAHSCAVRRNGAIVCWGSNYNGQAGDGRTVPATIPVNVTGMTDTTAIGGGSDINCAVQSGLVSCWGNAYRFLNQPAVPRIVTPLAVAEIGDATSIDAQNNICVVRATGELWCWGSNYSGQLGTGTMTPSYTPAPVPGLGDITQVAVGDNHVCALRATGSVACWGQDYDGTLGIGPLGNSYGVTSPTPVLELTDAVDVSVDVAHTCATRANGEVRCWGNNAKGQLGNGSTDSSNVPVPVSGLSDALGVSVGWEAACAVRQNGKVSCWGDGPTGRVAYGSTPVEVPGLTDAVEVEVSYDLACALRSNGSVACWGSGAYGQLGNGALLDSVTPVDVVGISDATAIMLNHYSACALLQSGQTRCWGSAFSGELGDGSPFAVTPVAVQSLPRP